MLLYSISIHLYILYSVVNMSSNLIKTDRKNKIQLIFLHNILKNIQCILGCSVLLCTDYSNRLNKMLIESLNILLSKFGLFLRLLSNIFIRPPQKIVCNMFHQLFRPPNPLLHLLLLSLFMKYLLYNNLLRNHV